MQIHWIATYLDPSFRDLTFVSDKTYRTAQLKSIKDGLNIMAIDIDSERNHSQEITVSERKIFITQMF